MISRHIVVAAAGIAALFALPALTLPPKEVWPKFPIPEGTKELLEKRKGERLKTPISYKNYMKDYVAFGDYLNYGVGTCNAREGISAKDPSGVLGRLVNGEMKHHPVMAAQCGLKAYGRSLRTGNDDGETALYADSLISLQTDDGAYRYPFPYRYYLTKKELPAGWTSGMSQGQAMSLMARAFVKTGDQRYVASGKKALRYLITPVSDGGVMSNLADLHPSLSHYVFFEEYVSHPANHTLNGFMFTLLGLYDWSQIDPAIDADQGVAAEYFAKGIMTLTKILPYYDMGSQSAYDLGYITFAPVVPNMPNRYHGVHIYLLNALYSIAKEGVLARYRDRWEGYIRDDKTPAGAG